MARAGSEDFSTLVQYRAEFRDGARRFDVGEPSNFALSPMVEAALVQIQEWTIPEIQKALAAYSSAIVDGLAPLGYTAVATERRAGHYLGLRHPHAVSPALASRLAEQRIYVSLRGPSLRVTPHLYNDAEDRERLVAALE